MSDLTQKRVDTVLLALVAAVETCIVADPAVGSVEVLAALERMRFELTESLIARLCREGRA